MPKRPSELPQAKVDPSPELERRTRRRFSMEYKLKVIAKADACRHGELGELLRREKLYSSQLAQWRRELAEGGAAKLGKSAPGPVSAKSPAQRENERLARENTRLVRELEIANDCLSLQKKALSMLDRASSGNDV
jgi:transposase-like protein